MYSVLMNRINFYYIQPNRKAGHTFKFDYKYYFMWVLMLATTLAMMLGVIKAIENHNKQQHLMLCESTKVSGNLTVKGCNQ